MALQLPWHIHMQAFMLEQGGRASRCLHYLHLLDADINALKLTIESVNCRRVLSKELDCSQICKIDTISQNIPENGLCRLQKHLRRLVFKERECGNNACISSYFVDHLAET